MARSTDSEAPDYSNHILAGLTDTKLRRSTKEHPVPPHIEDLWLHIENHRLTEGPGGQVAELFSAMSDFAVYDRGRRVTTDVLRGRETPDHTADKKHWREMRDGTDPEAKKLRDTDPKRFAELQGRMRSLLIETERLEVENDARYSKERQRQIGRELNRIKGVVLRLKTSIDGAAKAGILPPMASGSIAEKLSEDLESFADGLGLRGSRFWGKERKRALTRMASVMKNATGTENWEFLSRLLYAFGINLSAEGLRSLSS